MKIKKFTARTFAEALAMVKKELSQDAVILSSEEIKGLRPHVEVTAGVDYEGAKGGIPNSQFGIQGELQKQKSELRTQPALEACPRTIPSGSLHRGISEPVNPPRPHSPGGTVFRNAASDDLKTEISGLKTMIENMKNSGYEMSLPAKKKAILNYLLARSVRIEYALLLCDKTSEISDLPLMLSADIKIKRHTGTRKSVMLIGPTGVGKTTTIAKLAAQAVKAGRKAAIINLDTYRIGATEQVRIYSRILGIPLAVATNESEFRNSLIKFGESRDVVFIDTTGRNPKDEAYIKDLVEMCKHAAPLELHLLMNANGDDECMIEAYRSYRNLPIDYLGFTKIDEAVRFGALYNLLLTYQKPVAYITTGQRVPGDIEHASVSRLASLIVNKECSA